MSRDELLRKIERFMRRHDMTQSDFGWRAAHNKSLLPRLRNPDRAMLDKGLIRISDWMDAYDAAHPVPSRKAPRGRRFQAAAAA